MREIGPLQRRDEQLQRIAAVQALELFRRNTDLRRDVLEEILHRAAARLEEVPDAVLNVFQDVRELVLFNADRPRASRHPLKLLGRLTGQPGKPLDLGPRIRRRLGQSEPRASRRSQARRDGKPRLRDSRGHGRRLGPETVNILRALLQARGKRARVRKDVYGNVSYAFRHLPPALP